MNDEIIETVKHDIISKSQKYMEEVDDYDFWNEHIKFVEYYALKLAYEYGANPEVVQLGALLHDVALVSGIGTRLDHHEQGAIIAVNLLSQLGYDTDRIEQVRKCVYNHRSSHNAESIEEICVADADILAHFANIPMIFQCGFVLQKKNLREVKAGLRKSLQDDFDDLSDRTKLIFQKEYDNILNVLIKDI